MPTLPKSILKNISGLYSKEAQGFGDELKLLPDLGVRDSMLLIRLPVRTFKPLEVAVVPYGINPEKAMISRNYQDCPGFYPTKPTYSPSRLHL